MGSRLQSHMRCLDRKVISCKSFKMQFLPLDGSWALNLGMVLPSPALLPSLQVCLVSALVCEHEMIGV